MKHKPKVLLLNKGMFFCCAVLVVGGCTEFTQFMKAADVSQQPSALEYYLWAKSLTDAVIMEEQQKLKNRRDMEPVVQQVQMALLLSVPQDTTPEDEDLAFMSLEKVIESTETSTAGTIRDYRQFALIWMDNIKHRRIQRNLTNDLHNQVRNLSEQNKVLLKQIEALKSIEQQINKREKNQDNKP